MSRKNSNITVVLDTLQFKKLCRKSEYLPEGPNAKFWKDVDENGTHVISFNFPGTGAVEFSNGKKSIRAVVMAKMSGRIEPQSLLCDFNEEAFWTLVGNGHWLGNRRRKSASQKYIPIGTHPKTEGKGYLCHNHVKHQLDTPCGTNGFRAWRTDQLPPDFVGCPCGWAGLTHYAHEDHVLTLQKAHTPRSERPAKAV